MKNIISSIQNVHPLNEDDLQLLLSHFTKHIFPKKTEIIQGGRLDKHVYFIERGITRSYCIVKGDEVTTWFSREGDITFGLLDLYRSAPGFEYVQTLEECEAYSISIDELNSLYQKSIGIANWSRVLHQECVLALQLNRMDVLSLSASERYRKLIKRYPDLCQRVNLGYIASFLGITLSTLSKVRAQ